VNAVIGAGLLVQTVYNLTRIDADLTGRGCDVLDDICQWGKSQPDTRAQAYQRLLDRLRSVPGVLGTAAIVRVCRPIELQMRSLLLSRTTSSDDGRPLKSSTNHQFVIFGRLFFGTMGIPIVAAAGFERTANASARKGAIVQ